MSDFILKAQTPKEYPFSKSTLERWIREGRISAYKPGRNVLLRRSDLDTLILASKVDTSEVDRAVDGVLGGRKLRAVK